MNPYDSLRGPSCQMTGELILSFNQTLFLSLSFAHTETFTGIHIIIGYLVFARHRAAAMDCSLQRVALNWISS